MQYRYTGATGATIANFEYLSGGGSAMPLGGVYAWSEYRDYIYVDAAIVTPIFLANGTYNMTVYSGSTECILSVVIDI